MFVKRSFRGKAKKGGGRGRCHHTTISRKIKIKIMWLKEGGGGGTGGGGERGGGKEGP